MTRIKLLHISPRTAIGVVLLICIWGVFTGSAGAISNVAPDPTEYGRAGDWIRLSLSNIPSTRKVTQIKVPVYVTAPATADPASIRADVELYSFYLTYSGTYNRYRVWFNDGGGGGAGRCLRGTGTLQAGNFTWSPEYNLWVTTVYAILRDTSCNNTGSEASNAKIDFRMRIRNYTYTVPGNPAQSVTSNGRAPSAGGNSWISYSVPDATNPTNDSYFFSTDARQRGGGYANYNLKFATPCNITSNTRGTIILYDLDDNHSDNNGGNVSVSIRDTRISGTSHLNITRSGSMGNNGTYRIAMDFQPGGRYELRVNGIYYWNVLQYRLPFDNIAYVTGCGAPVSGELSPILDIDPDVATMPNGMSFSAYFRALNTASADAPAITEARIWYDTNRDSDFNTGESVVYHRLSSSGSPDTINSNTTSTVADQHVTVDSSRGSVICISWQIISTTLPGVNVDDEPIVRCIPIIQSPFTQVWGNDLRVGGRYVSDTTDTSNASVRTSIVPGNSNRYYGSWAEYGILAPGDITGTASGSGLAGGGTSATQSQWSKLSFANYGNELDARCMDSGAGCYATDVNMGTLPDIAQAVDDGLFVGVPVTNSCSSIGPATTTLTSSNSRIIRCSGTLTIAGNIQRTGTFSDVRSIPQFIIIADRINIHSDVTRLDVWLIASGSNAIIDTCSNRPVNLTLTTCDKTLEVNGPTIAKALLLGRTAGASSPSPGSSAAERFNMRADTYLWAYTQAQRASSIRTSYIQELPPRY